MPHHHSQVKRGTAESSKTIELLVPSAEVPIHELSDLLSLDNRKHSQQDVPALFSYLLLINTLFCLQLSWYTQAAVILK